MRSFENIALEWTPCQMNQLLGQIHTGRARSTPANRIADVNGSVHTARKQHQRICTQICVFASSMDWALEGLLRANIPASD